MNSFSIFHFFIALILFSILYLAFRAVFSMGGGGITPNGSMICPHCGTRGDPQKITKGSLMIEVFLWLCFIIPGVIYTLWRLTSRYSACPSCLQAGMIQARSPMGKQLIEKYGDVADVKKACPYCHTRVDPTVSICPSCKKVL